MLLFNRVVDLYFSVIRRVCCSLLYHPANVHIILLTVDTPAYAHFTEVVITLAIRTAPPLRPDEQVKLLFLLATLASALKPLGAIAQPLVIILVIIRVLIVIPAETSIRLGVY